MSLYDAIGDAAASSVTQTTNPITRPAARAPQRPFRESVRSNVMKTTRPLLATLSMLLLTAAATVPSGPALAGDFDLKSTVDNKGISDSGFGRKKLLFTFDTRVGYDDNTLASPDSVRAQIIDPATGNVRTVTRDVEQEDSVFLNFSLGAVYTAANPRYTLSIGADVGVNYFFDRPGDDVDVNSGLTIRFTDKITPRLLLEVSSYNAYQSEPDFGASNITGFNGQNSVLGQVGGSDQRNGDYFYTTDRFALAYQVAPRISTVLAYNIVAFAYEDDPYSTVQDRVEHYISPEFRYLLTPQLTLVANYRFSYVDYFNVSNDSYSHYILGGADYSFNPRFRFTGRAGVEFRSFVEDGRGDLTAPYVEAGLTYDLSTRTHISLQQRYGIEEGDLTTLEPSTRRTYRGGFLYDQNFTARLSGYVSFYYNHSSYEAPTGFDPVTGGFVPGDFDEDSFDVAVGLRYAINRHFSAEVGYTHTDVLSDTEGRDYDRNRYFAGLHVQF